MNRRKLSINNKLVIGNEPLKDFPVLLNQEEIKGEKILKARFLNGKPIKVLEPDTQENPFDSYAVVIPTLHCTKDTKFYIYYEEKDE